MLLATWTSLALAAPLPVAEASVTGAYTNVVPDVTLFTDYVEICFVSTFGATLIDLHPGGGPTTAGNCVPGTPGYLLELIPRPRSTWVNARAACLAQGMRLPELFELLHACENSVAVGFAFDGAAVGWASNTVGVYQDQFFQVPRVVFLANECQAQLEFVDESAKFLCAL